MKKYALLFAAGGLLTLASCGGDSTPAETTNVDSIAAVKADSIAAALKAQSDSTIAAQAQAKADSLTMVMRADSIAAAERAKMSGKSTKPATKKTTTTEVKSTVVEQSRPERSGGLQGNSDQEKKGGLQSHSDQEKKGGLQSHSDQDKR